jgi:acyl-CoA hydrolase
MEVGVRVDAENPRTGEKFKTAKAYLTFVAIDDKGKPKLVPSLELESDDDKRRYKDGKIRKERRLAHKS